MKYKVQRAKYLVTFDNSIKYKLKTIYKEPQIKKIIVHISINEFIKAYESVNTIDNNVKIKAIFLFHILFSSFPSIKFQNVKIDKTSRSKTEGISILQITITDKNEINSFLSSIFFENLKKMLFKTYKIPYKLLKKNSLSYNIKISGKTLFPAKEFFNTKAYKAHLNQIFINVSLIYTNIPKNQNITNILQNTFFFDK